MKKLRPASNEEVWRLIQTLYEATRRPNSERFLDGFPWTSTAWYLAEFNNDEFDKLFLFWDGSAWGESSKILPRQLKQGTQNFIDTTTDNNFIRPIGYYEHFIDILRWRDRFKDGIKLKESELIIVIGDNSRSKEPFMILDGNHRAVAALWWANEVGNRDHIPRQAWLGLSPHMSNYSPFSGALKRLEANKYT